MKHISLFSGLGGFDIAAQWMGWDNVAHCEINPFCQQILKYYWPNATTHTDIRTTDFTVYRGKCDILTMGPPCQPYSTAGKRLGKEDERHLWPEGFRAVREISPRFVVFENVRGLTNWNGGMVFDEVQADLESAGYEVTPFLLPAAGVNAPHRRDRIWIVAYASGDGYGSDNRLVETGCAQNENEKETQRQERAALQRQRVRQDAGGTGAEKSFTDPPVIPEREQANEANAIANGRETWYIAGSGYEPDYWRDFPTQSPLRSGDDGLSGRLDRITFPKWCEQSITAAGNAIVPQIAYQIFQAIEQYDRLCSA